MISPVRSSPSCRAFEEAFSESFDGLDLLPSTEEGTAGSVLLPHPAVDLHLDACASCRQLVEELAAHLRLLHSLTVPAASADLGKRLLAIPTDLAERREAEKVMALLVPGALVIPPPSTELMSRLFFLPSRSRQAAKEPAKSPSFPTALRRLFGDWRVSVAAAYVATLLVVMILKVDPLSVARSAATDLTTVGEHALAEARTVAVDRLKETALVRAAAPLTSRLDYRLYRTVAAGRARAAAYSQLVFEKVLGGTFEERRSPSSPVGLRNVVHAEPPGLVLRS